MQIQCVEPRERREVIQLPDIVIGEIDDVELIPGHAHILDYRNLLTAKIYLTHVYRIHELRTFGEQIRGQAHHFLPFWLKLRSLEGKNDKKTIENIVKSRKNDRKIAKNH